MGDDDGRTIALIEIGDLDAVDSHLLQRHRSSRVMPGLVPGTDEFPYEKKTWMAGTRAMTRI